MGSLGGGASKSSSGRISVKKQQEYFDAGLRNLGGLGAIQGNTYVAPKYQGMMGGDYDAYQKALYDSATAGLGRQYTDASQSMNDNLAKRGIWSSGLAQRSENDLNAKFGDIYARAGADAAAQRYQMQSQDLANQNQFNQNQAQAQYAAQWKPTEFLADLWNGSSGQFSKSSSWNASASVGMPGPASSDRRLKKNITQIAVHPKLQIPIYTWTYLWDEPGVGVMADELAAVLPDAVSYDAAGFASVDYGKVWG